MIPILWTARRGSLMDNQIPHDIEIGVDEKEGTGVEEDGEKW